MSNIVPINGWDFVLTLCTNTSFYAWFIENEYKFPEVSRVDNELNLTLTFATEQEAIHFKMRWL